MRAPAEDLRPGQDLPHRPRLRLRARRLRRPGHVRHLPQRYGVWRRQSAGGQQVRQRDLHARRLPGGARVRLRQRRLQRGHLVRHLPEGPDLQRRQVRRRQVHAQVLHRSGHRVRVGRRPMRRADRLPVVRARPSLRQRRLHSRAFPKAARPSAAPIRASNAVLPPTAAGNMISSCGSAKPKSCASPASASP